jgi:membrane protease YdiL (CAAX protease family)
MAVKKHKTEVKKTVPTWVKVISIFLIIQAAMCIVVGAFILFMGGYLLAAAFLILAGIVYLKVWMDFKRGKNWARIFILVLMAIAVLTSILGFILGIYSGLEPLDIIGMIPGLVISAMVFYYLKYNKEVIKFFKIK